MDAFFVVQNYIITYYKKYDNIISRITYYKTQFIWIYESTDAMLYLKHAYDLSNWVTVQHGPAV